MQSSKPSTSTKPKITGPAKKEDPRKQPKLQKCPVVTNPFSNKELHEGLYVGDPCGKFQGRTLLRGKEVPPRKIPHEALYITCPIKPSGKPEIIPVDPRIEFYKKLERERAKMAMNAKLDTLSGISEIRDQIEEGRLDWGKAEQ